MYVTLPNLLCFESVFTHLTWNCLVIHNWVEQKTETQNPSYSEFLAVFYSTRLDFNVFPISPPPFPQCVEMKLRWRFYVHASTCPEISFWSCFWIIFDVSNTRPRLGFAQKHIWNTTQVVFEKSKKIKESENNLLKNVSNMLMSQF